MIKQDKIKHLIAGFIINVISSIFIGSILINLIIVMVIGCLKELYDYYKQVKYKSDDYEVSIWDVLATISGGIVGIFLIKLIQYIYG